ncbi:MAG: NAD(P)/FAD-dependent oxidoreductase [Salinigranum sp.]
MRVAVLGAGYAGVTIGRHLEDTLPSEVEIVVVNDTRHHLVRHEVHRVLRRPSVADLIEVPLTEVFDRATVVVDRVEEVSPADERVRLADNGTVHYDYAAVCLGSETAFYDLPGVREHATPLRDVAHAERVREAFLDVCDTGGRVVVGGGGLSGIQVAGELAALRREEGADVEVVLVEQLDSVAPSFPANFQGAVRDELEARDVIVRTETSVVRATADELVLADARLEEDEGLAYDLLVWTGGIRGSDALARDRPRVRSDLRFGPSTFVLGDAARVVDADGEAVPASASTAIREARTVASNLRRLVEHDREGDADDFAPRLDPYRFDVPGWIVSVGDGAVAQLGPTVLTGPAAKAMKATVGAGHLTSVGSIRRAVSLVEEELAF